MYIKYHKALITVLGISVILSTLIGCGGKPSEEKILSALKEGKITVEDAKSKGWIDDTWIDKHFEKIKASAKIHNFNPFETTYLDGKLTDSSIIKGTMHIAIFNSSSNRGMEQIKILNSVYDELNKIGIPVLGVVLDKDLENAKQNLKDVKFPIIIYSDSMKESFSKLLDFSGIDYVSAWTKEGGIYSAWSSKDTNESLVKAARDTINEK